MAGGSLPDRPTRSRTLEVEPSNRLRISISESDTRRAAASLAGEALGRDGLSHDRERDGLGLAAGAVVGGQFDSVTGTADSVLGGDLNTAGSDCQSIPSTNTC